MKFRQIASFRKNWGEVLDNISKGVNLSSFILSWNSKVILLSASLPLFDLISYFLNPYFYFCLVSFSKLFLECGVDSLDFRDVLKFHLSDRKICFSSGIGPRWEPITKTAPELWGLKSKVLNLNWLIVFF